MIQELSKIQINVQKQIRLINNNHVDLMDKIILVRSMIENYAIYNFLKDGNSEQRIELFQCFGDFEWYSHQIYYSKPKSDRINKFRKFLITAKEKYPFGYYKYGRLIKRRLCKELRSLIKKQPTQRSKWQSHLDLINSNQTKNKDQQITLLATYMSHHLITKLPFPYRVIFGKSITYFVIKYSHVNKNTYWLLADLSHGTLIENHLDKASLNQLIKKLITSINSHLED